MIIFYVPHYKIREHDPGAPGAGALATGHRIVANVGTHISTAVPSWRPSGFQQSHWAPSV